MSMTSNGLTIVDIAGSNGSHESALVILDLLCQNMEIIEQIFGVGSKADTNQVKDSGFSKKKKTWRLKIVNAKQLKKSQKALAHLFYWAGFYGWEKIKVFFLEKVGVSPFMKLFRNQSVIDACVIGQQYEMLKDLVENTKKGINDSRSERDKVHKKYDVDFLDFDYYWKSRQKKDAAGNNTLHLVF